MFYGQHLKTLDDKDRIIVPAEFRKALESGLAAAGGEARQGSCAKNGGGTRSAANEFFLTIPPGLELCLSLYPTDQFVRMFLRFKPEECFSDPEVQAYARLVVGRSRPVSCDRQGRLHLPAALREECEIEKEVFVVGVIDHVEIWDTRAWNRYYRANRPTLSEVATRIHRRERAGDEP